MSAETGKDISVGSVVPVQFVSESGSSLPPVNGTVVSAAALPGEDWERVRLEILLLLSDLAEASRS